MVIVTSLPITCAQTMVIASGMTGLILPGMMLLPGCNASNSISAKPAIGPLFIHRKSLAIFVKLTKLNVTGSPVFEAVEIVGSGAVPLMLLLLGMQLARTSIAQGMRIAGLAAFIKLVVAPIIALPLANWLGLAGPTLQACVVEASMPTAVLTTVLAIEFDAKPKFVTSVVFLSTLISPISLTPIIALVS